MLDLFKQNKNRGAGLVTVVVVLAISSIFLAGSVLLSFNHYKNVIRSEIVKEEIAEIELFAKIVNESLITEPDSLEMILANSELLSAFYRIVKSDSGWEYKSITIANESSYDDMCVIVVFEENDKENDKYVVSCGETSRMFYFDEGKNKFLQEVSE